MSIYTPSRFGRAIAHFFVGRVIQGVSNFLLILVLVRLLSVNDFGVYVSITALVELAIPLLSFGMFECVRQYVPVVANNRVEFYKLTTKLMLSRLLITGVTGVVVYFVWPDIARQLSFDENQIEFTRSAALLVFLVLNFRFIAEIFESLLEQGKAQFVRAIFPVGKLVCISLLVVMSEKIGLRQVVMIEVFMSLICFLIVCALFTKKLTDIVTTQYACESPSIREFLFDMTIVGWANACLSGGTLRLIVATNLGLSDAALFGFVQSLQNIVQRYTPVNMFQSLVRPMLISAYDSGKNPRILQTSGNLLWKLNLMIVCTMIICLAWSGDWVLSMISGGRFLNAGAAAVLMFSILLLSSTRTVMEMVVQITGHAKQLRRSTFAMPIILVLVWWSSSEGIYYVVMTHGFGLLIWNLYTLVSLKFAGFEFRFDVLRAAVFPIATLVLTGASFGRSVVLFSQDNAVTAIFFTICFLCLVYWAKPFVCEEYILVRGFQRFNLGRILRPFVR